LTTNDRAVVELDYTIPQGYAPGTMLNYISSIYDLVDNGGNAVKFDALEIQSDTETDGPSYEIISISSRDIDVTDGPVDITVRFRITDESGVEERNLDSRENSSSSDGWESPGLKRALFWEEMLYSNLSKPLCNDTLYLDEDHPQAQWVFRTPRLDFDGDGSDELILQNSFDSPNRNENNEVPRTSNTRIEGDVFNGIYETTITISQNAYPGLYDLQLDVRGVDDIHGNYRYHDDEWQWEELEDREAGSDRYPGYVRIQNSNFTPPEED
jgi:hypothetical protein